MERLISRLDYDIKTFVERWMEGDSRVHWVPLSQFGILEPLGEDELEQIYISIQHIEKITQDEDGMLYITVDEPTLKAHLVVRLDNWKERSDLKEFGRYENRGVI